MVAGLLLAALLCAPALHTTARNQPHGPVRSVLVTSTDALSSVSSALRLDVPWHALHTLAHGTSPPAPSRPDRPVVAAPMPRSTPSPTSVPAAGARPGPTPSSTPTPNNQPSVAAPRVPTVDDPLRVWVAGDSMWERPGPPLVTALEATGVVDVVELEFRYSTGLTRADVFDWPAHARSRLASLQPEVVLFLVGPNDAQPLVEGGVRHEPATDGFRAAYTARVRHMMETLAAGTDHVLWIGLPVMRSDHFDRRMVGLDRIYAAQAAEVDGVRHVPTRALFAGPDGAYASHLPGPDGTPRPMRNRDGIHLSRDGGARLARHLVALLDDRHDLIG